MSDYGNICLNNYDFVVKEGSKILKFDGNKNSGISDFSVVEKKTPELCVLISEL